jgi:glycosyltransferase involved in cell wall biosynthesis
VPPERIVTVPGGVDTRRFHPDVSGLEFRRSLGVPDRVAVVGMASNFRVMKGHAVLLEALRRLLASERAVHLLLVGRGPTEAGVRAEIDRMGLGKSVTIAGFRVDVPQALAACDVGVYASRESEGMSRVVFEYLALGKALVATRVGAVPELLRDGETALLVPAEEPECLAAAIGRLVDEPARRRSLGQAGAALIEARLSSARVAERLLALYAEMGAGRP